MDIRKVKKLIELLEESDIEEIEIKEGEECVRITRRSSTPAPTYAHTVPFATAMSPAPTATRPRTEAIVQGYTQKSPMVGTFYTAPSPGESPYVNVGQQVQVGDVICIIEAMKMMNQIEADRAGVIESILIENAEPVEFDQPLFTIV